MNEIAHRARMQRSAIYHYFSGKSAIMVSLIELHHEDIHALVQELFGPVLDRAGLESAVGALVSRYFRLFLDDPVLPAVWMGAQSAPELSQLCSRENEKIGGIIGKSMQRVSVAPLKDSKLAAILLLELIGASARLALQADGAQSRGKIEAVAKASAVAVATRALDGG